VTSEDDTSEEEYFKPYLLYRGNGKFDYISMKKVVAYKTCSVTLERIDQVISKALKSANTDGLVTVSHSHGSQKNPLRFEVQTEETKARAITTRSSHNPEPFIVTCSDGMLEYRTASRTVPFKVGFVKLKNMDSDLKLSKKCQLLDCSNQFSTPTRKIFKKNETREEISCDSQGKSQKRFNNNGRPVLKEMFLTSGGEILNSRSEMKDKRLKENSFSTPLTSLPSKKLRSKCKVEYLSEAHFSGEKNVPVLQQRKTKYAKRRLSNRSNCNQALVTLGQMNQPILRSDIVVKLEQPDDEQDKNELICGNFSAVDDFSGSNLKWIGRSDCEYKQLCSYY
jgi:hypothetical protein